MNSTTKASQYPSQVEQKLARSQQCTNNVLDVCIKVNDSANELLAKTN